MSKPAGKPATEPVGQSSAKSKLAATANTTLKVIETGDGDKSRLTVGGAIGDRFRMGLVTNVALTTTVDGTALPAQRSPIRHTDVTVTITAIDSKTEMVSFDVTLDALEAKGGAGVDAQLVEGMTNLLHELVGLKGKGRFTRSGRLEHIDFANDKLSASGKRVVPEIVDELHALEIPLPRVPVGVGARWQITEARNVHGIRFEQRTTYTLTRRDASGYEITYRGVQSGREQDLSSLVPDGHTELRLIELEGGAEGTIHAKANALFAHDAVRREFQTNEQHARVTRGTDVVEQKIEYATTSEIAIATHSRSRKP